MNYGAGRSSGPFVAVYALVGRGDQVLLVRDRRNSAYQLPGGLVTPGEAVHGALHRTLMDDDVGITRLDFCAAVEHRRQGDPAGPPVYEVALLFDVTPTDRALSTSGERERRWVAHADLGDVDLRPAVIADHLSSGSLSAHTPWWPAPA